MMCNYCDVRIYCKAVQYSRPLLAPATDTEELRQKLLDKTGEIYVPVPKVYCPVCGSKVKEGKE